MPDPNQIQKKNKIGMTGFAGRVAKAEREEIIDGHIVADNRIVLMLDNSGSMGEYGDKSRNKTKIDLLKEAVQGFTSSCDFSNTAVGMYAIPPEDRFTVRLTQSAAHVVIATLALDASGGTPLGQTMSLVLKQEALTRGVIVSDGCAHDPGFCYEQAAIYAEQSIPIDCVHIGSDIGGEETLQKIAKITGGNYIKFKDVSSFAGAMKYLAPRYRAMLSAPGAAKLIGADEIR